jgi:uncharacterized protein (TIGR03435 family)
MMLKTCFLRSAGIVALLCCFVGALAGQTPVSPAFEVASIKLDKSGSVFDRGFAMPADRFEAQDVPLKDLIAVAYGEPGSPPRWLAGYQIVGGPNWMNTDMFDVVAKAGSEVPLGTAGERQKLLMLRALLAERFKLIVNRVTREVPIYALVLARSDGRLGPRLQRSIADCEAIMADRGRARTPPATRDDQPQCLVQMGLGGELIVHGQTMATVADVLSHLADRLVRDRTGLLGRFDLDLHFTPDGVPGLAPPPGGSPAVGRPVPNSGAASIFTAVEEQLGLKLESTRGPVDVLVVDRAEHPTEN